MRQFFVKRRFRFISAVVYLLALAGINWFYTIIWWPNTAYNDWSFRVSFVLAVIYFAIRWLPNTYDTYLLWKARNRGEL